MLLQILVHHSLLKIKLLNNVDSGKREVTFVDGSKARLVSGGLVLDGSDNSDIKTKALSDLRAENIKVTVVKDEKGSDFAKYFVYEKISSSKYEELKAAQKGGVSKTDLNTAITAFDSVVEANYTTESYKAYKDAVDAAKTVQSNTSATQAQVDAAAKSVTDAKAALVTTSS